MVTEVTKNSYNNVIDGVVLYAKSTVDGSLVAVTVNPATGAIQCDTEMTAAIDPTGLATSAKQLPDGHAVTVDNSVGDGVYVRPGTSAEFPLPAAQVATLTPPAAITGFATSANQGDSYRDIGSPVRIIHNSTSQAVAVPAGAKAFICMAEGGPTRCEIGGAASATSTIYVAEEASIAYPITGGSQTLFAYGTAGYGNFRFLG